MNAMFAPRADIYLAFRLQLTTKVSQPSPSPSPSPSPQP